MKYLKNMEAKNNQINNIYYEKKRRVYLAIRQLLADTGLDQQIITKIVEKDIYNKIIIKKLNKTTNDGKFIEREIRKRMGNSHTTKNIVEEVEKEELKNKIIKFVFYECNNTSFENEV